MESLVGGKQKTVPYITARDFSKVCSMFFEILVRFRPDQVPRSHELLLIRSSNRLCIFSQ